MLKRFVRLCILFLVCLQVSGCSVFNLQRFKYKVNSITEDLFSQSTITMPVLVTATSTSTPTLIPTPTQTPTAAPTNTATPYVPVQYSTPTFEVLSTAELPFSSRDIISSVKDVTIPDGTILEANQLFIKSWRLTNNGVNTWTEDTKLIMDANYRMDTPEVVKAIFIKPNNWMDFTPGGYGTRVFNVGPGTEVDLAVILKAPAEPGDYQIDFRLINPDGEIMMTQFWMRFSVSRPTETPTPEPSVMTPTPGPMPYDWNGRWMVREPYLGKEIVPANAWFWEQGGELIGLIYCSNGDPAIARGTLTENGRVFTGELFSLWQNKSDPISWRMQASRRQFYAVTELGVVDDATVCGSRNNTTLPMNCALPAEG